MNHNAFVSRHIRQGTHINSLSFALHDDGHAINTASVVSVCDHYAHASFAVLVVQS